MYDGNILRLYIWIGTTCMHAYARHGYMHTYYMNTCICLHTYHMYECILHVYKQSYILIKWCTRTYYCTCKHVDTHVYMYMYAITHTWIHACMCNFAYNILTITHTPTHTHTNKQTNTHPFCTTVVCNKVCMPRVYWLMISISYLVYSSVCSYSCCWSVDVEFEAI